MLRSKYVKFLMSILKQQVDSSPNFASLFSFVKDNSSVLFLALTTYTLLNRSPLKWKILKLSSAQIKIFQIPYVSFETTSRLLLPNSNSNVKFLLPILKLIPLQILHPFSVSWTISLCTFLAQTIYTLLKRNPLKWKFLRLSNCSGKNSSISSCHLWNGKTVPLQALRNFSLWWQITPLWTLSSHFFKFGLKDPSKVSILSALEKNCHIPHIILSRLILDKSVNNVLGEGI